MCKALVHLQKRCDILDVPQVGSRGLAIDLTIHRIFKQDGAQYPVAVESGARHDARSHLMHDGKHFVIVRPGILCYAIKSQCLGCAAAALIERSDEARRRLHFFQLLFEGFHFYISRQK